MKQFILKNIVLAGILVVTLIASVFLIYFIWEKSETINQSMEGIESDVGNLERINATRKPNSVAESEKKIKADTETLNKKTLQVYRYFGKPYRPALLKFIKNIASTAELKTDLPVDPSLVAKPKLKPETSEENENEDEEVKEVAETAPAEPSEPTDEEKAVFDPASNRVVLSFDEDTLHAMLADLYKEVHQESEDDSFVIPDTVQSERAQLFEKLFNQMIEAPEAVDPARAEDFRKAAAAKFAQAFAIFRDDIQPLTLEDITYPVAHELFLDALGLPRLMRQRDCKNYIDILYEKYLNSDIIPGLPTEDQIDRERAVQDFIYGKNLNRQALPVPEMVIPIIRNFQIKEDLFRRMKEAGIGTLSSMTAGVFYGTSLDNDSEGPVLNFTYTMEMLGSMDAIDAFINSLHAAYKTGRVYQITSISLVSPNDDLMVANALVADHIDSSSGRTTTTKAAANSQTDPNANDEPDLRAVQPVTPVRVEYALTDPRNSDYGRPLIGENRDEIKCTIVVNYLLYRADNITPQ